MRLKESVRQINLLSLFFLLNLNFVISTRIAKLAPVLTGQNSIRVQGIFFGVVKNAYLTNSYDENVKIDLIQLSQVEKSEARQYTEKIYATKLLLLS